MPTQRLSMRRIRDVLRLRQAQGLTERLIARTLGVSNGVVHSYLRRARVAGLTWPLPEGLDDEALDALAQLAAQQRGLGGGLGKGLGGEQPDQARHADDLALLVHAPHVQHLQHVHHAGERQLVDPHPAAVLRDGRVGLEAELERAVG